MGKFLFLFCILILFCFTFAFISALDLTISPHELSFEGKTNQNICSEVRISSETYNGFINVSDKWSKNSARDIQNYNLDSSEFRINMAYENSFNLNKGKTISVCLNSRNSGDFYGVLLFRPDSGNLGIGVWIKANISGAETSLSDSSSLTSLTGNSILSLGNSSNSQSRLPLVILVLDMFMLLILTFLIRSLIKKKRRLKL